MVKIVYILILTAALGAMAQAQNPQPTPPTQQPTQQPTQPTGPPNNPQQTPTQNVGTTGGVAPAVLPDEPPPVAPNFRAPARPLPDANRVGVDIANQLPMTLEEAITLALKNNNNIDISRNDVQVAEYNLRAARGVYDPLLSSETGEIPCCSFCCQRFSPNLS